MDRQLTVEFPWLALAADANTRKYKFSPSTDSRKLSDRVYCQESKIDLSGYVMDDLTVGFRRSFEQLGSFDTILWKTYDVNTDFLVETTFISSVPFSDDQLILTVAGSPGFTHYSLPASDWGNFNRAHIIHGTYNVMYANSTIGAGAFTSEGNANLMSTQSNNFSSLEPTAADCLYCYRVFSLPIPGLSAGPGASGVQGVVLPPKRVILDAFTVEEPELEYMMRLKRSYELANQV
jgi:hypothetical protein